MTLSLEKNFVETMRDWSGEFNSPASVKEFVNTYDGKANSGRLDILSFTNILTGKSGSGTLEDLELAVALKGKKPSTFHSKNSDLADAVKNNDTARIKAIWNEKFNK